MGANIYLPRLGQTMTEGTILRWLKNDGEEVQKGEEIFELEYDKATVNIESPEAGILRILVQEGQAAVSSVIGLITDAGASLDLSDKKKEPSKVPEVDGNTEDISTSKECVSKENIKENSTVKALPSVRKLAREKNIELSNIKGTGTGGTITIEDVIKAAEGKKHENEPSEIKASSMAKKIAREYGVDLSEIKGSHPSDRITKDDVLNHKEQQKKESKADEKSVETVPLAGMRKVIAQRMVQSAFTAPHVTYSTDVDMSEMSELRDQSNEKLAEKKIKLSFTDLIIKAVARALEKCPNINIRLEGDSIKYMSEINVGMAVAIDKGLIVPVVKNSNKLSVEEISIKTKELAEKARKGALKSDEISGGTFTVTNLGMYGIDMFTPIINQPESAILGIGRTVQKPVVIDKQVVIRPMMVLSLSADHRVIDGAPAAQFLSEVKKLIEKPQELFNN